MPQSTDAEVQAPTVKPEDSAPNAQEREAALPLQVSPQTAITTFQLMLCALILLLYLVKS